MFEGLDGAGKSTQARAFWRRLRRRGRDAVLTREPGGTPLGRTLRRLIVDRRYPVAAEAELLLIAAARAQLMSHVVRPTLAQGGVVVADRYTPSTWAYQGAGRGISADRIAATIALATSGLEPDVIVLLDLPPEIGLQRIAAGRNRPRGLSRFESQPLDFAQRVRQSYLDQAAASPTRWLVFDARQPSRTLSRLIWDASQRFLDDLGQGSVAQAR